MSVGRSFLQIVGSVRFAALLLLLLLVAMACATVVESARGTEWALARFYKSWWFESLLALLAVNVLGAVLVRYPFKVRQVGFVLTHGGILLTLCGAAVTQRWGVDGQLALAEGETTDSLRNACSSLTVINREDLSRSTVELPDRVFSGLEHVNRPEAPVLTLGELRVEVIRYLADAAWRKEVRDDGPHPQPAVEVSLSETGRENPIWLAADQPSEGTPLGMVFRVASDQAELERMLNVSSGRESASQGMLRLALAGATFEFPIEACSAEAVPVGNTAYRVRVLRYLPHAVVGPEKKLVNASDRPVNPAIEVELSGPEGTETHVAFARYPDLGQMHGGGRTPGPKVTFVAAETSGPVAPVEVIGSQDGQLYARFESEGGNVVVRPLQIGEAVDTPWPKLRLNVLRLFERARAEWTMVPEDPVRETRAPAVLVTLTSGEHSSDIWVQKHQPRPVTVDGVGHELRFGDRELPLGFTVALNHFRIGYYPGTTRPRSYESHITITDPRTGQALHRVVSMNHPVKFGGYSFFQSSYSRNGGQTVSVLSVSRDPGLPVVFAGYVTMVVGMVWVLGVRMWSRRPAAGPGQPSADKGRNEIGRFDSRTAVPRRSIRERREKLCCGLSLR